jgi:hypothetical protein
MSLLEYADGPDSHDWFYDLAKSLRAQVPIHTREWQSQDTSASPAHATRELINVRIERHVDTDMLAWQRDIRPNLPWAEEHFGERVSGIPHNPPPSHVRWPWGRATANAAHTDATTGKFSHTYPERLWPKRAGEYWSQYSLSAHGIRGRYGDLTDVVSLLIRSPLTRQAYIPIWFPEDTGNVFNVRVPCTLGYHLMIRDGVMHCWYPMRSCDLIRHLRDDIYMAGRLVQWVCDQVNHDWNTAGVPENHPMGAPVVPGTLNMTISSLHAFVGDDWRLDKLSRGDES